MVDTEAANESAGQRAEQVSELVRDAGLTVGVAESLTGGQLSAVLARASDASSWFAGGIVAYETATKHRLLGVPDIPVISEECARAMAEGAARALDADVTVAVTGVGGPERQEGQPPGVVWIAVRLPTGTSARHARLSGDAAQICAQTCDVAVGLLLDGLRELPATTTTGTAGRPRE